MPISKKPDSDSEAKEAAAKVEEAQVATTELAFSEDQAAKCARPAEKHNQPGPLGTVQATPEVEVMGPAQRERVRLGEALRKQGIDEHAVAATYADVVEKLLGKTHESDNVEKLLVDILKECSKHLEEDAKAVGSSPVRVTLVHNVARPQRNSLPAEAQPAPAKDPPPNAEPVGQ